MTDTEAKWAGWWRASKWRRWEKLAEVGEYGECLDRLIDATRGRPAGELLVTHKDPNADDEQRRHAP